MELPTPDEIRQQFISDFPKYKYSDTYIWKHTIVPNHEKGHKQYEGSNTNTPNEIEYSTSGYMEFHKYSYPKLWDLIYEKFQENNVEYLNPSLFKDVFLNRNKNLYSYVYRIIEKKRMYYIKLVFDTYDQSLSLVSFHLTNSKDKRFKQ